MKERSIPAWILCNWSSQPFCKWPKHSFLIHNYCSRKCFILVCDMMKWNKGGNIYNLDNSIKVKVFVCCIIKHFFQYHHRTIFGRKRRERKERKVHHLSFDNLDNWLQIRLQGNSSNESKRSLRTCQIAEL